MPGTRGGYGLLKSSTVARLCGSAVGFQASAVGGWRSGVRRQLSAVSKAGERPRARAERSEASSGVLGGRAPGEDSGGGGRV